MPLLLLVLVAGGVGIVYLAAYHLAREYLTPPEIRCRHCHFHGRLAPRARGFLSLLAALVTGNGGPGSRACPACGSTSLEEADLTEEDFLQQHFAGLSEPELRRILDEKPAALTPVGLRFAREELDRRHRG